MPRRDFSVSPLERQFISLRVGQTNSLREINAITQSNVGADLRVGPLRCGFNIYSKTSSLSHSLSMSHSQASIRIREHLRGSYKRRIRRTPPDVRMAREFDVRQPHAAYQQLICANGRRRLEAESAGGADDVVLIDAVAADADSAHQSAVFEERGAAREDLK